MQISATGAKIAVDGQTAMPENFQIAIPQRGIDCGARLMWRRAGHAGIAFKVAPEVEAEIAADTSPNSNVRLQALEAENKALRVRIDKLTAQLNQFVEGY